MGSAILATDQGIEVEYVDSLSSAGGVSTGRRVQVCKDLPDGERFAVLAHERMFEGEMNGKMLRQTAFFFANGDRKYVVTCTVLADGGERFDELFADSIRTFRLH